MAAPPAAAPPGKDEGKPPEEEDSGGLFGPIRIGALVGGGLPSVLGFGAAAKLTRFLGGGLNVGLIPSVKLSLYGEAELSYQEYDVYGRLFPFGGDLFVGAGVGYASIKGKFTSSYDTTAYQSQVPGLPNPVTLTSEGSIRTLVLTPAIGLLHIFGSGLTLGVDVGAQIPIAPSTTHFHTAVPAAVPSQIINQYVAPNDRKVQDTLNTIGRTVLPTLNVRIGWFL